MKSTFLFFIFSLITAFNTHAETVKIKITYKNQPVVGHSVTALIGGTSVGSDVTDENGELSFSVGTLATRNVDLQGEKSCDNGRKTWEVKGYVLLDDNNFAHLKMEEPIQEAAEGSGGMISADMLAASWGLLCSGSSSGGNQSAGTNEDEEKSAGDEIMEKYDPKNNQSAVTEMSYEERLQAQKTHLENKVYSSEKKIGKKQEKLEKKDLSASEEAEINLEIKELELEKALDQNKLDEVNLRIEKGNLNKKERDEFKTTEKDLKAQLKSVKEEQKSIKSEVREEKVLEFKENVNKNEDENTDDSNEATETTDQNEITVDIGFNPDELVNKTEDELREMKTSFTTDSNNKSLKRRVKGKWMDEAERIQLEKEIEALDEAILLIEAEFERRKAEKKAK